MKTKTLLELITLSSSIYYLAKDTELLEKIKAFSEKGRSTVNEFASSTVRNEDGEEMEFIDKLIAKTHEAKEELEQKIEELVAKFYKNINVAHMDEIKALHHKIERSDTTIALLEARLNRLEGKS